MKKVKEYIDIIKTLQENGFEAFLVGGCVRDKIMGIEPKDYDITTSALPEDVLSLFEKTIPTGIKYGTISVVAEDGRLYEITTYRSDGSYSDGRRPDMVQFGTCLIDDLARRDFTINAIAYDPVNDLYIDPYKGRKDIEKKILKCVGNPSKRFLEDALRIMRSYRFQVKYGLKPEKKTDKARLDLLPLINNTSYERINCELMQILSFNLSSMDIDALWPSFCTVFPILKETNGFEQKNPHHLYTLDEHIKQSMQFAANMKSFGLNDKIDMAQLRLALMLHDIGKVFTQSFKYGIAHYYEHAEYGAKLAKVMLKSRKFSNEIVENVSFLIQHHQDTLPQNTKNLKKYVRKIGKDKIYSLMAIQFCDKATHQPSLFEDKMIEILNNIDIISILPEVEFGIKSLEINGNDVMKITGLSTGKEIGKILKLCLEMVLNGECENSRESLIKAVKGIKEKESY